MEGIAYQQQSTVVSISNDKGRQRVHTIIVDHGILRKFQFMDLS